MKKQTSITTIGTCLFLISMVSTQLFGQFCDAITPTMNVDLTSSPTMNWISPSIVRDGNCCGTSNPDKCLEFVITLNPAAVAINFNIASGAIPPGAMFYQVNCGPSTPVGSPICLDGPGPHHLTFCKPGNNSNTFNITSLTNPFAGPDTTIQIGCNNYIFASGFEESSIEWTSIFPGIPGEYDGYLGCTSGCDTTIVTPDGNAPNYIDYMVCGESFAGCGSQNTCDTVRVYFTEAPEVTIDVDTVTICAGQSIPINASISGGTAPYTILWNTGETSLSINAIEGEYIVEVTDALGCSVASDTALVIENTLDIDLNAVEPLCNDATNGSITCIVNGGVAPYNYLWSNGATSVSIIGIGAGEYWVEVTDALGCSATVAIELSEPEVLTGAILGDSILCANEYLQLVAQVTGGTGTYSYIWTPSNTHNDTLLHSSPTSQTYSCTITDINNCSVVLSTEVMVNTLIEANLNVSVSDDTICVGENITLSGYYFGNASDVTLAWAFCPTCPTNESMILSPSNSTEYILIATDECGQQISDTVAVEVIELPEITLPSNLNAHCQSEGINLANYFEANENWTYDWSFGDGSTSASPIHYYTVAGNFQISVTVTNEYGCSYSANGISQVSILPQSVASFTTLSSEMASTETMIQFNNQSENASYYLWNFGDNSSSSENNPVHVYTSADNYQVQLIANSPNNCPDTAYFTLVIKPGYALYVPNAFTPDNDGHNNYFLSSGYGIASDNFKMEIYDRWGTLVFQTDEKNTGWDGYQASKPDHTQDGVFSWVIYFKDSNGYKHVEQGHLSLLK